MTTEYEYTDPDGDMLHIVGDGDWVRLDIADAGSSATVMTAAVLIAAADVRKVTAVMHEKAGLPDRWAALRVWLGARWDEFEGGSACSDPDLAAVRYARSLDYRAALRHMDELEAGR